MGPIPVFSSLIMAHGRPLEECQARPPKEGGVLSSGEVEGPGPLCPAAIRNTGVGLLVWNSGPASSFLPCWGQIRRKGGKLVMGGLEWPQESWDGAPASSLVPLHAGTPPALSLGSLVYPNHTSHPTGSTGVPQSPSVAAEP